MIHSTGLSQLTKASRIIRYSLFTLLPVLFLALLTINHSYSDDNLKQPVILILGDSLSAGYGIKTSDGWVTLLEMRLKKQGYDYRIVNASISGETTGGGLSRLPTLLQEYHPNLLLIELGANDGLRGFPIKMMRDNLARMITQGKKTNAQILLIGIQLPLNYGPRYTQLFEKSFSDTSKTLGIPLVPSLLGKVPLDKSLMQADGLHPTARAQPQLLEYVWPHLQPLLIKPLLNK